MAEKFLKLNTNGVEIEQEALVSSAGAGDAGKIPALGGDGRLNLNMLPTGIGPSTKPLRASEALTAPCMVNIWNDAGTAKVRYADASTAAAGKEAHGFILASVASGAMVDVYFEGEATGFSALTPGNTYYLSNSTPGGVVNTPVTTSGHILQRVGVALGTTSIDVELAKPIIRA